MSIERTFDLIINAGTSSPLVINANQNDSGEIWKFNLYQEDGTKVIPAAGEIVGLKSDGHAIVNAGTVNESGQVVITETAQITAAVGANVFEIVFDSVHGTANFILYVEKSPVDDDADFSESDISAIQQAIAMAIDSATVQAIQNGLAQESATRAAQDAQLAGDISEEAATRAAADAVLRQAIDDAAIVPAGSTVVVDNTLSIAGAAADAKKTGDAVSDLNQALSADEALLIEEIEKTETVSLTIQSDGFYDINGVFTPDVGRKYAIVTGVTEGETYLLSTYLSSTLLPAILYFNDTTFKSYEKTGTGTGETVTDYEFTIPSGCNKIIVQSASSQVNPSLKKEITEKKPLFYTKEETDELIQPIENDIEFLDEKLLEEIIVKEQVDISVRNDGFYGNNGVFVSSDHTRAYAIVENVAEGEEYALNTQLGTVNISAILYFENSTFKSKEKTGTGSAEIVTDYHFIIPSGCNKIIVQSSSYSNPPVLYKFINEGTEPKFYTKEESDLRYQEKISDGIDGYGVRWSISNNDDEGERCGKAIGLSAAIGVGSTAGNSDFDNIYPWSEMKRCNIITNANGADIVVYEGEAGFALDGSNGDVYVRIPKFSIVREKRGGYEYRIIGVPGAPVHEAFIEDGNVLDEIFVGAFEGTIENNVLHSYGGKIPTANETGPTYLTAAKANNADKCTLYDMRCVDALWTLMAVEFGKRNSNRILGYGYSDYYQPIANGITVIENATDTNSIKVSDLTSAQLSFLPIGSTLTICDTDQANVIGVREIESITSESGYSIITISGDPVSVNTNCFVGSGGCITNFCETCSAPITYHTGRANYIANSNTKNPVRYRWIENIIGSLWHNLPDVTFDYLQAYMCKDMKDYEFGKHTGAYKPVGIILSANADNGDKSDVTGANYWVTELLDDTFAKPLAFGKAYDKSLISTKAFGAYYYLYNNADMHIVNGGGFDHLYRSNILTQRAWQSNDSRWYLYGARLIRKNV